MTDKLTLKLGDDTIQVEMDDNGRYSLNDLFRASGADNTKNPYEFFLYSSYDPEPENDFIQLKHEKCETFDYKDKPEYASVTYDDTLKYLDFLGFYQGTDKVFYLNHIPANSQKYLYIFKDEVGRHKIGVTKNVPSRKKGLEQASGLCLDTVYFKYLGSVATKYEKRLHDHYKDYNTSGEWFNFSKKENFSDKDLIEEVKALIETYERIKPTYENNIPQDLITEATALQNMLENLVTKSSLKVINILLERKLNRLAGYHNKFSSTKLLKEIVYTDDLNSMYALIVSQKTIIRFLNVGVSNYHTIAAVFDVITHKNKHILAASKV